MTLVSLRTVVRSGSVVLVVAAAAELSLATSNTESISDFPHCCLHHTDVSLPSSQHVTGRITPASQMPFRGYVVDFRTGSIS